MDNTKIEEIWAEAKNLLKAETTEITFQTWIERILVESINDNNIILSVETPFHRDTLQNKYLELIKNTFNYVTHKKCNIIIKLKNEIVKEKFNSATPMNRQILNSGLNPTYTFETFVVGTNNQFAQAAAKGVSEAPGLKFNPFFIYGGVGLGKTHLMHAIGNQILENNPSAKILYITSETFTNQLVNALKDQTTENFREKYRSIDALLIDDIQFIAGKKSTQEEFFHTFNALYESGKQIILTCDRPPKELELLEERLKSRFEWGLLADISNPDYETRLAILRQKADLDNILINDDILTLIATNVDSNIRALEGILKKLIAKASLTNSPITIEMAQNAIDTMITSKEKVISSEYIQEVIGKYFDINPSDLTSSKRSADVTFPRQIAMYLCRNVAQMSLPQIGNDFGKRDHTTVMHACNKIETEIKNNVSNTKSIVESVKKILLSNNN